MSYYKEGNAFCLNCKQTKLIQKASMVKRYLLYVLYFLEYIPYLDKIIGFFSYYLLPKKVVTLSLVPAFKLVGMKCSTCGSYRLSDDFSKHNQEVE